MLSNTLELTDLTNVYVDANGYKTYYGSTAVQFIPISATRAIIAHAQIYGTVSATVTPYVTSKIYYSLVDFSGADPVLVATYVNQDPILASMSANPYNSGSFVQPNGDIVSTWGFQVSDMLNTLPPTDDGVAVSSQRGYVGLIIKIQVSGDTITPVYSTSVTHSASSTGTGWTNGSAYLYNIDNNATAIRTATRGGTSYTDTIDLTTGLPVGGSHSLGGFSSGSFRIGNLVYYMGGTSWSTYNLSTKTFSGSTTYPAFSGSVSISSVFVSNNGKIYGSGSTAGQKQRIYEFIVDGGGLVQTTNMYAANINFRDITSLYANSLGQREDYLNRLADFGPERNYWLPDNLDSMTSIQPFVMESASALHLAGWFTPVYNTYPKSIAGPTIFSDLKPYSLAHNIFGISPETVVIQPDIDWNGSNIATLILNDHGWYSYMQTNRFIINNKFVFLGSTNNSSNLELGVMGNNRVHVFTASP